MYLFDGCIVHVSNWSVLMGEEHSITCNVAGKVKEDCRQGLLRVA
jgi:hypothetical protein